jgi:hypothetical protein
MNVGIGGGALKSTIPCTFMISEIAGVSLMNAEDSHLRAALSSFLYSSKIIIFSQMESRAIQ